MPESIINESDLALDRYDGNIFVLTMRKAPVSSLTSHRIHISTCTVTDKKIGESNQLTVRPKAHRSLQQGPKDPRRQQRRSSHHQRQRCQILLYRKSTSSKAYAKPTSSRPQVNVLFVSDTHHVGFGARRSGQQSLCKLRGILPSARYVDGLPLSDRSADNGTYVRWCGSFCSEP